MLFEIVPEVGLITVVACGSCFSCISISFHLTELCLQVWNCFTMQFFWSLTSRDATVGLSLLFSKLAEQILSHVLQTFPPSHEKRCSLVKEKTKQCQLYLIVFPKQKQAHICKNKIVIWLLDSIAYTNDIHGHQMGKLDLVLITANGKVLWQNLHQKLLSLWIFWKRTFI